MREEWGKEALPPPQPWPPATPDQGVANPGHLLPTAEQRGGGSWWRSRLSSPSPPLCRDNHPQSPKHIQRPR